MARYIRTICTWSDDTLTRELTFARKELEIACTRKDAAHPIGVITPESANVWLRRLEAEQQMRIEGLTAEQRTIAHE